MKVLKLFLSLGLMAVSGLFIGCTSSSYPTVPSSTAGTALGVETGTVISVRKVNIEGEGTYLGQSTGAIMGGAIGSTVGGGSTSRTIASAAGAAAGMIVGQQVEKTLTAKVAQEMTIELDDGGILVVVQEFEEPGFMEGDRVNVMQTASGNVARVRYDEFDGEVVFWNAHGSRSRR